MSRPVLEVLDWHAERAATYDALSELRQARTRVNVLIRAARSVTATGDDRTLRMAVEELRAALAGVL